jgi:hypothetical protein
MFSTRAKRTWAAPAFLLQEVVQGCAELGGDVVTHGYK